MLTIKERRLNFKVLWVIAAAALLLTGCEPPGTRALLKGERLLSAGKYPEAVAKLEQATGLLADAPPAVQAQAWDWLGVARQYAGQPKEALDAYTHALKLDRNLAPAACNLGNLYLEHGNYRAAIDEFNTALALPRTPEIKEVDIYLKIGIAYQRLAGQTAGPEKLRLFENARRYLDAVHKSVPGPEELNATGLILLQRNHSPHEAVTHFKEALRLDPSYTPAQLNLAIVHHYYLGDLPAALQEYRAYIAAPDTPQAPKPVPTKDVEAVVQALERQLTPASAPPAPPQTQPPPAAKPVTNAVLAPKPPPAKPETNTLKTPLPKPAPPASTNAPKAAAGSKEKETAAAQEETAGKTPIRNAATNPPSATPSTNPPSLQAGVSSTNSPKPARLEVAKPPSTQARYRYLQSATLSSGNHNEALRLVAQGFTAQQKTNKTEAMICFQRAIKADPACFDAYFLLGGVARESGNLAVALDSLERAVSLKPESPDARYAFAWTLSKAKFPQDCADELEKLLKQTPNETRAHLLLGNTYAQELGETRLAREHYQRVLDLEPAHPQATSIRAWLTATDGL